MIRALAFLIRVFSILFSLICKAAWSGIFPVCQRRYRRYLLEHPVEM